MEVGIAKAKDTFSELIDRAEKGEVITVTRHGKAVAAIGPSGDRPSRDEIEAVVRDMDARRSRMPRLTDEEIVAFVREGRKY